MQNVYACADCGGTISRQAVLCPHCGRQYADLRVSRSGWSMTVAWGVILSGILLMLISIVATLLMMGLIAGAISSATQQRTPSTYNR